jgi:tetratricopeptide (TPR) repeat protein
MQTGKSWILSFLMLLSPFFAFSQSAEECFKEAEQKFKTGNYQEAVDWYSKAIQSDGNNLNYFFKRGFAYGLLNKYEEAILDYSRIIEKQGDHIYALTSRGSAYNKLGKYNEAMSDFNHVLEIDPKNQEAFNNRGWCKKFLGDMDGACKDWHQSKKMGNEEAKIILKNNKCR